MAIKARLEDMVIGDKIICAFYGSHGSMNINDHFNSFGTNIYGPSGTVAFVSGSTENFYFIYAGNDFKGRMILVADRNVCHSISWDQLNTMGVATKDGVEVTSLGLDPTQWKTNIRLLTGGTSDATKANSEWDKYIVNGPFPGDNAAWNWSGIKSFSSTSAPTSSNRVIRGGDSATAFFNTSATGSTSSTVGFRPVLVAESLVQTINNKYLIQDGEEIKTWSKGSEGSVSPLTAVPKMTSNTSPEGKAFAKTEYDSNYAAWYAFNQKDDVEGYASANGSGGVGYLGYEFSASKMIAKYAVRSMSYSGSLYALPKDWTFEGSNDSTNGSDGTWEILDTQVNQTWTTASTDKEYMISQPRMFKMYRLNWTANNGFTNYTDINELKMYEGTLFTPSGWISIGSAPATRAMFDQGMDESALSSIERSTRSVKLASIIPVEAEGPEKILRYEVGLNKFKDIKAINILVN